LLDSTNIVVGTMIGSAIFLVPHTIAQNIHSAPMTLVMWLLAGVMSMFGALAYAELGAMMPSSGGLYVYIREAWGPLWGFLCGWTLFLVARSGATAAIAAGFSIYFSQLVPMSPSASRWVAAILILALTLVNYRGVRLGATVQNVFTGMKLLGLLVLTGSTIVGGGHALAQPSGQPQELSLAQFGTAMLACIFSYNGWLAIGLVGGEIKDPQRNLPRAIILGVGGFAGAVLSSAAGICAIPVRRLEDGYTSGDTRPITGLPPNEPCRIPGNFDAEGWPSGRWRWS
jgi:APA family basic amino acid/polyamine antiporter